MELQGFSQGPLWPDRITIPYAKGFYFIDPREIIYCKSNNCYVHIHLVNKDVRMVCMTMNEMEQLLAGHGCIRCHRCHIINLRWALRYDRGADGGFLMADNEFIEVSDSYREPISQMIMNSIPQKKARPVNPGSQSHKAISQV